ncbi:MAG: hypothetical protein H8D84_00260 [Proteobacteria bacterium]|nr:hypothetical protein [Pseudomonadota bacterium]
MKLSRRKQPKNLPNFIQYRTHHEIDIDDDDGLAIVGTVLTVIVGLWWGLVHIIDIFFDKLSWWMEPLTIIPFLAVALPTMWVSEMYGRNPMHWWPMVWGTKVTLPDREPFHAYDEKFEKVVREFGPTRIYVVDYNTLKFRTKKDATLYCLRNLS